MKTSLAKPQLLRNPGKGCGWDVGRGWEKAGGVSLPSSPGLVKDLCVLVEWEKRRVEMKWICFCVWPIGYPLWTRELGWAKGRLMAWTGAGSSHDTIGLKRTWLLEGGLQRTLQFPASYTALPTICGKRFHSDTPRVWQTTEVWLRSQLARMYWHLQAQGTAGTASTGPDALEDDKHLCKFWSTTPTCFISSSQGREG